MSGESRMLTHQQAKAFYDRLGSKQDQQAFYEVPAATNLIAHAAFEAAQSVFEAEMKWMVSLLPLSFQFYAVAARQKAVRQFLKRYFTDYREVLATLVKRDIDRGEFRPVPAERVAIAIAAL